MPNININILYKGLTSPVDAVFHKDTIYIADQIGKIFQLKNGTLNPDPVLDLSKTINKLSYGLIVRGLVSAYDERGLLGIALHPDFPKKPLLYAYYSRPGGFLKSFKYNHVGRLSEFTFISSSKIDPRSERILFEVDQEKASHNGGCIKFDKDGFLYLAMGDGGRYLHLLNVANAQDLSNPKGAILKIKVTDKGITSAPDNFSNIHPLLWAWGLRNPWRFSFDQKGRCFVGDVGESSWEAIYLVTRGDNCGWPMTEGSHAYAASFNKDPNDPSTNITDPIFEYPPEMGRSVIGGYVYRGSRPDLRGLYIFADASGNWPHRLGFSPTGKIYALRETKEGRWQQITVTSNMPEGQLITSLAENDQGELFVLMKENFGPTGNTGSIAKLV